MCNTCKIVLFLFYFTSYLILILHIRLPIWILILYLLGKYTILEVKDFSKIESISQLRNNMLHGLNYLKFIENLTLYYLLVSSLKKDSTKLQIN